MVHGFVESSALDLLQLSSLPINCSLSTGISSRSRRLTMENMQSMSRRRPIHGENGDSPEHSTQLGSSPKRKAGIVWTSEEDAALLRAVKLEHQEDDAEEDWDTIALSIPGKSAVQCLKRFMALSKERNKQDGQHLYHQREPNETSQTDASTYNSRTLEDEDDEDVAPAPSKKRAKLPPVSDGAGLWTQEEIELLSKLVEAYKDSAPKWNEVAANFPKHNAIECLTKWQTLSNPPVIKGKGSWTAEVSIHRAFL